MSKIYSWRTWEIQAGVMAEANAQELCFLKQFRNSVQKPDYMALRLGFITVGIRSSYTPYMFGFLANYSLRVLQDGLLALSVN
ncbi:hypothetical protein OROMI_028003 [Orobanche minor]